MNSTTNPLFTLTEECWKKIPLTVQSVRALRETSRHFIFFKTSMAAHKLISYIDAADYQAVRVMLKDKNNIDVVFEGVFIENQNFNPLQYAVYLRDGDMCDLIYNALQTEKQYELFYKIIKAMSDVKVNIQPLLDLYVNYKNAILHTFSWDRRMAILKDIGKAQKKLPRWMLKKFCAEMKGLGGNTKTEVDKKLTVEPNDAWIYRKITKKIFLVKVDDTEKKSLFDSDIFSTLGETTVMIRGLFTEKTSRVAHVSLGVIEQLKSTVNYGATEADKTLFETILELNEEKIKSLSSLGNEQENSISLECKQ